MRLSDSGKRLYDYLLGRPSTRKQLEGKFNAKPSTVSNWLMELDDNGLLGKHREGRVIRYTGREKTLEEIVADSDYQPITSTLKNPDEVYTSNAEHFKLGAANTLYAGGITNKKLFRNFLRFCEREKTDAVVITGNLFYMDLKRYGSNTPERTKVSDLPVEPEYIRYPESVIKGGRDPIELRKENRAVYITSSEKLEYLVDKELPSMFLDEKKEPLYGGDIYLVFGDMEEQLVKQHVNQVIRETVKREQIFVRRKTRDLRRALKDTKNDGERKILEEGISDWEMYLNRVIMSYTDDKFKNQAYKAMQEYVIDKIEDAIPNSRIISTGRGHLRLNDKIVRVLYNVKKSGGEGSMTHLLKSVQQELSKEVEMPDIILQGGLSETYSCVPVPYVGKQGKKTILLVQLPTCLDEGDLEEIISKEVKSKNPMGKLAQEVDFNTGGLIVEMEKDIPKRKILTNSFLTNDDFFRKKSDYKVFYEFQIADQHHGSKYVTLIETEDDLRYLYEVAQEFVVNERIPVVRINSLGDEIQEKNYPTEAEQHPEYLSALKFQKYLNRLKEENNGKGNLEVLFHKAVKRNSIRTGILMPQEQQFEFLDLTDDKLIRETIRRAEKVGLYGPVVVLMNGNHNVHTFEGMHSISSDIARELRIKAGAEEGKIIAPILGKSGCYPNVEKKGSYPGDYYEGLFGIIGKDKVPLDKALDYDKHYLYGEYMRHKQGSTKWGDPTKSMRQAFNNRGQFTPVTEGRFVRNLAGHDHIGGQSLSENVLHEKCYCMLDRNEFGEERDYASPTRGIKFLGLPVNGPATGPIIAIDVFCENLDDYANGKLDVNMKRLFDHSVIYDK